jgi:hypothetical protein
MKSQHKKLSTIDGNVRAMKPLTRERLEAGVDHQHHYKRKTQERSCGETYFLCRNKIENGSQKGPPIKPESALDSSLVC